MTGVARVDLRGDQPAGELPEVARVAAEEALGGGQTHYVDVAGVGPLRAVLGDQLGRQPSGVLVTAGVQEARFLAIQILGDTRGPLAIPAVVHPGVRRVLGARGLRQISMGCAANDGFLPTLSAIREALKDGARLIYLESPSRLAGAAYTAVQVAAIVEMLEEHGGMAIWDQGLQPWSYPARCPSVLDVDPGLGHAVVLGEAYSGVGLDGWFVGYLASNEGTIATIETHKQIVSICTSTAAQFAAVGAAQVYPAVQRHQAQVMAETYENALEAARARRFRLIDGHVSSLLAVSVGDTQAVLARLDEEGIQVVDGAEYGAPGVIRLATVDEPALLRAIAVLGAPAAGGAR